MAASEYNKQAELQAALQQLSRLQWQVIKRDLSIAQGTRAAYLAALSTPSQTEEGVPYLRTALDREDHVHTGVLPSARTRRATSSIAATPTYGMLSDILQYNKLRPDILSFLYTRDACELRVASEECRAAVALHPWHDDNSVVNDVALWRKCFPKAISVYVVGGYALGWNVSGASLHTFRSLSKLRLNAVAPFTDKSLNYVPMLEELVIMRCSNVSVKGTATLRHLRRLAISNSTCGNMSDFALRTQLESLEYDGICDDTTGFLLCGLRNLSKPDTIRLTDVGLAKLGRCFKLHTLSLNGGFQINGTFLRHMPTLKVLTIRHGTAALYNTALQRFIESPDMLESLAEGLCEHLESELSSGNRNDFRNIGGFTTLGHAVLKHAYDASFVHVVCGCWSRIIKLSFLYWLPVFQLSGMEMANLLSSLLEVLTLHGADSASAGAVRSCLTHLVLTAANASNATPIHWTNL